MQNFIQDVHNSSEIFLNNLSVIATKLIYDHKHSHPKNVDLFLIKKTSIKSLCFDQIVHERGKTGRDK